MRFASTRRQGDAVSLDEALVRGLAEDGGLYLPESLPRYDVGDFDGADSVTETASVLLRPFFAESCLRGELEAIVAETFTFPVPARELPVTPGRAWLLELFHGPTAAFKDVGARFLAACLSRLEQGAEVPLTVLVATSGDTGGAVAGAFAGREGVRVAVLFPDGRVSERQRRQLTGWGGNVLSLAVKGSFDDCQALVKQAMIDPLLRSRFRFTSANSINIGRLLPQCSYYAHAALAHHRRTGRKPGFIVPTGNLGNGLACILARRMGLPVGEVVLATNANRIVPDYLDGAEWASRTSLATLASAMDVGNPSNMERLMTLAGDRQSLQREIRARAVSDADIERQIAQDFREFGFATCPHTATATFTYGRLREDERTDGDWIIVATAHPAKFERIVEPLIGEPVPVPDSLQAILSRPERSVPIAPELDAMVEALDEACFLDEPVTTGDK
ncbi:MAG TPA: threonine synthase [Woeseiaceae bacterium]|nr:threonine synthase [Woeseiaceae bacterium]